MGSYLRAIRILAIVFCIQHVVGQKEEIIIKNDTSKSNIFLTAQLYSKLFEERRKEQVLMTKQTLKMPYEKKFKLLKLGYSKIIELLNASNDTLTKYDYSPLRDGFPQKHVNLQESVILILENCCIAGESVLHFPEISYRIFDELKVTNWKTILNWCINFVHTLAHVTDEHTFKMMTLLQQEINEEMRAADYVNPYYENLLRENGQESKPRKTYKKLKKGPRLSSGKNEL